MSVPTVFDRTPTLMRLYLPLSSEACACFANKQGLEHTVLFCGDGINDLSALSAADVGYAVGATEASVAAAVHTTRGSVAGTLHVCSSYHAYMLRLPHI